MVASTTSTAANAALTIGELSSVRIPSMRKVRVGRVDGTPHATQQQKKKQTNQIEQRWCGHTGLCQVHQQLSHHAVAHFTPGQHAHYEPDPLHAAAARHGVERNRFEEGH